MVQNRIFWVITYTQTYHLSVWDDFKYAQLLPCFPHVSLFLWAHIRTSPHKHLWHVQVCPLWSTCVDTKSLMCLFVHAMLRSGTAHSRRWPHLDAGPCLSVPEGGIFPQPSQLPVQWGRRWMKGQDTPGSQLYSLSEIRCWTAATWPWLTSLLAYWWTTKDKDNSS